MNCERETSDRVAPGEVVAGGARTPSGHHLGERQIAGGRHESKIDLGAIKSSLAAPCRDQSGKLLTLGALYLNNGPFGRARPTRTTMAPSEAAH